MQKTSVRNDLARKDLARKDLARKDLARKDLARLLRLFRPYAAWMLGGVGLSVVVVIANVGLLALSGWFITGMALAGLGHMPI